jgi:hypothetical protein
MFVSLVGTTSKGRKGTSWEHIRRIFEALDHEWTCKVPSGLSSGEGLIWAVRNPIIKKQPVREKGRVVDYQDVTEDHGVSDKRLLVFEPEFASVLNMFRREGNVLSALLRQAWDTGDLSILTKNSPAKATGAHISVITHITQSELSILDAISLRNGFANRFLWVMVRRSKHLPEGGNISRVNFEPIIKRLRKAVDFARCDMQLLRDPEAQDLWIKNYRELSCERPGSYGYVTARGEAQVRIRSL